MSASLKRLQLSGEVAPLQKTKFINDRLDAIKGLNDKITAVQKGMQLLTDEINKVKETPAEVKLLDIHAIMNQIEDLRAIVDGLEIDEKMLQFKDEVYNCIEEYIVQATPRLSTDITQLELRIAALEKKNEKVSKVNIRSRESTSVEPGTRIKIAEKITK